MTNNVLCYLVVTKTYGEEVALTTKFEYYEKKKAEKSARETLESFYSKTEYEDFIEEDYDDLEYLYILIVYTDGTTVKQQIFN